MNIKHHPSDELLLDYGTGALSETWSLAVATHLSLCPACRRAVSQLEAVGGHLIEESAPVALSSTLLENVMACLDKADAGDEPQRPLSPAQQTGYDNENTHIVPQPLFDYLGGDMSSLNWQRLGMGAYQMLIATGDTDITARLLRIPAGRPVPEHTHGGLELTLVLSGAFEDATGTYARGDLQIADADLEHQPTAVVGEDCICLAVTDAPLRFKSLAARLVQPFIGI